jgi:TPR repeat protein
VSVFYFSGHGAEVDGRNLAFGVDASVRDWHSTSLDVQRFLSGVRAATESVNIVIFDACRELLPQEARGAFMAGFRALEATPGTLLAYATSPGKLASGVSPDVSGLSLYTKHLVREIRAVALPVEQVFKNIRLGVYTESGQRQLPWEHSSLTRDYYFSPGAVGVRDAATFSRGGSVIGPSNESALSEVHELFDRFQSLSGSDPQRLQSLLKELTRIDFAHDEIRAMSIAQYRAGVRFANLQDWARNLLGAPAQGGLLVASVDPGSVTHRLGVKEGDILVSVNDQAVTTIDSLSRLIGSELARGSRLNASVIRNKIPRQMVGTVSRSSIDDLVMEAAGWKMDQKDYKRAQLLATWAADRGNSDANVLLANLAANGFGNRSAPDHPELVRRAQMAADAGNTRGKFWLVQASLRGWGLPKSYARANELRNEAAADGAPWAIAGLGIAYMDDQGLPRDYVKARNLLEQGAALGNADGMVALGWLNEHGLGVPKDLATARMWYERALQSGNDAGVAMARKALRRLD